MLLVKAGWSVFHTLMLLGKNDFFVYKRASKWHYVVLYYSVLQWSR